MKDWFKIIVISIVVASVFSVNLRETTSLNQRIDDVAATTNVTVITPNTTTTRRDRDTDVINRGDVPSANALATADATTPVIPAPVLPVIPREDEDRIRTTDTNIIRRDAPLRTDRDRDVTVAELERERIAANTAAIRDERLRTDRDLTRARNATVDTDVNRTVLTTTTTPVITTTTVAAPLTTEVVATEAAETNRTRIPRATPVENIPAVLPPPAVNETVTPIPVTPGSPEDLRIRTANTTVTTYETVVANVSMPTGFMMNIWGLKFLQTCFYIENCESYIVDENYINFGCLQCSHGYTLERDEIGAGVCRRRIPIPNCSRAQVLPNLDQEICITCDIGFVLNRNGTECLPLANTNIIAGCRSMVMTDQGTICNRCQEGLTLTENLKACIPGCNVENCAECIIREQKSYCLRCNCNYLAVVNKQTPGLSLFCLSCDTWARYLFTPNIFSN